MRMDAFGRQKLAWFEVHPTSAQVIVRLGLDQNQGRITDPIYAEFLRRISASLGS